MTQKERYGEVLGYLKSVSPPTDTELFYHNPFELLVAVVLSAQCTDKRVNMVVGHLFHDFPTPQEMAESDAETMLEYIHSISYPNSKAKYLVGLSKMLVDRFDGKVPSTIEELTQLPGVGRKTANVVQAIAFGKPALAVDTHVFRVSHRLGLVPKTANTPYKVEQVLTKNIPTENIAQAHFWLLYFGRYTCTALRPHCEDCKLRGLCIFFKSQNRVDKTATRKKK